MGRKNMAKHGKAFAAANPSHFLIWKRAEGVNQGVAVSASQWAKYGFSVKNLRPTGNKRKPLAPVMVNLSIACPATGFVKSSCGCVRCGNARKNNKRVR